MPNMISLAFSGHLTGLFNIPQTKGKHNVMERNIHGCGSEGRLFNLGDHYLRLAAREISLEVKLPIIIFHKKKLCLFIMVKYNNNKVLSFVSQCGHL